jgi:hypothetical protein
VQAAEAGLEEWKVRIAEFRRAHPNAGIDTHLEPLGGGAGGVRDWAPSPYYDRPTAAPTDEETTEVERVPGAGHSLSRSVPRPRKPIRRGEVAP